jgi:hypothetical protein
MVETDLESLDLAEPTVGVSLVDAVAEITDDLGES